MDSLIEIEQKEMQIHERRKKIYHEANEIVQTYYDFRRELSVKHPKLAHKQLIFPKLKIRKSSFFISWYRYVRHVFPDGYMIISEHTERLPITNNIECSKAILGVVCLPIDKDRAIATEALFVPLRAELHDCSEEAKICSFARRKLNLPQKPVIYVYQKK